MTPRDIPCAPAAPVLVRFSDVQPKPLRWLWPDRIPLGKLTLIAGDPGRGKSLLTIDIASRITTGRPFPDGTRPGCPPGSVLFISAEDDLADTVRPRLDAAGADVSRIAAMRAVSVNGREHHLTLGDIDAIAEAIDALGDTRLVVIDPVSAYLGDTDDHKNSQVRALLAPLCALAADRGVAVVAVTHLRKGDGPAMYRSMGSLGFVATARCAWLVTKHPLEPDLCAIARVKGNVGRDPGGLAYRVRSGGGYGAEFGVGSSADSARGSVDESGGGGGAPWIEWVDGRVDVEVDASSWGGGDGDGGGGSGGALEEAKRWLQNLLASGGLGAVEVRRRAVDAGITEITLQRAKRDLAVVSVRQDGQWVWEAGGQGHHQEQNGGG